MKQIATDQIYPPHEIKTPSRYEALVASMREHGWQGRPLLVLDCSPDGYAGITGSHRWAAAKEAGLASVPCHVIDPKLFSIAGLLDEEDDSPYEYRETEILEKHLWGNTPEQVATLELVGDRAAAELMQAEIDSRGSSIQ